MLGNIFTLWRLIPPEGDSGGVVNWRDIEQDVGFVFSHDYKQLVESYGAGSFDDFLWLLVPGHSNNNLNQLYQWRQSLWSLRELLQEGEDVPFDVVNDSKEIVPWAVSENGDVCYWNLKEDPDGGCVVVNESRAPVWEWYKGGAVNFLLEVFSGECRSSIFPEDFPSDHPMFSPI